MRLDVREAERDLTVGPDEGVHVGDVTAAPTGHRLRARDVMSAPVVTAGPRSSLWWAWRSMRQTGLRHLVVTEQGRCVGMLDDRALFALWPIGPLAMRNNPIASAMRIRVHCVLPDTDLGEVARIMILDAVDAVPVVDARGHVLGIITGGDVASVVARYGVAIGDLRP